MLITLFGLLISHAESPAISSVRIGNFLRGAPCGIAWVINNSAAFVLDTGGPYVAGTAAPDDSYHAYQFTHKGAQVLFEWGRVGNSVVGRLSSDRPTELTLSLSSGWPGWTSKFVAGNDGATGYAQTANGRISWRLRTSPAPRSDSTTNVTITIEPEHPTRFSAGLGRLPAFAQVDGILTKARRLYDATRPQASGDLGDFVGAIADNINNSRIYSSDNHTLAYSVSRRWSSMPNGCPYFCWDSFLTANLAAIADPAVARATVLAMLAYQTPQGMVPNFAHWNGHESLDRSQPPVASLCVWKMHERYPADRDFLAEVYPKLVRWHNWWMKYRNTKHDGLLEWGSSTGGFQAAQYETGWDDNLEFGDLADMRETTMDTYAVDLSSMWSMDAHYLALIADFLGYKSDAAQFRKEQAEMNQRINERLWNRKLGCYCSRFWDDAGVEPLVEVDPSTFGSGFNGEYFADTDLRQPIGTQHATRLVFKWNGQPPVKGAPIAHWSARWRGTFTPTTTALYQLKVNSDGGFRVFVDGNLTMNVWRQHPYRLTTAEIKLTRDQAVSIVIEYFQPGHASRLEFLVEQFTSPQRTGAFLTRLTPMNFYPLSAEAADTVRAQDVLKILTNPEKFWGRYLLPTLGYDDPDYHEQEYWRGDVWGPPNYLVWQGIKKYASPSQTDEFALRNVELFMSNWFAKGVCGENYLSTNGEQSHDPHYTWGALLNLIGLESIVDVDDSGRIVLNGTLPKSIILKNIPLLGRLYDVRISPGAAQLIENGKVVLTAKGKIVRAALLKPRNDRQSSKKLESNAGKI